MAMFRVTPVEASCIYIRQTLHSLDLRGCLFFFFFLIRRSLNPYFDFRLELNTYLHPFSHEHRHSQFWDIFPVTKTHTALAGRFLRV